MSTELFSWRLFDLTGAPLSGVAPKLLMRRNADNFIYDWTDGIFKSTGWTTREVTLTETDSGNFPGVYERYLVLDQLNGLYQLYGSLTVSPVQYVSSELNIVSGVLISNALQDIKNSVLAVPAGTKALFSSELSHLAALQNGLTSSQALELLEIYSLFGLDPTKPLIVTPSSRSAGTITQNIATSVSETIVTRV
jgi:hypothetical protein